MDLTPARRAIAIATAMRSAETLPLVSDLILEMTQAELDATLVAMGAILSRVPEEYLNHAALKAAV